MTSEKFRLQLKDNFPFEPTDSQTNWFNKVADFILSKTFDYKSKNKFIWEK